MADEEPLAQVIRLHVVPVTDDDGAIVPDTELKRTGYEECRHSATVLDQATRRMYCDKNRGGCGREIDLYEWIQKLISEWERWTSGYRQARAQAKHAGELCAEAERLERNAKARLRSVRKRLKEVGAAGARREMLAVLRVELREEPDRVAAQALYDRVEKGLEW